MTRDGAARIAAVTSLALGCAWLGGFIWFATDAIRLPPSPPAADGIVALTGGADRVATAIALLHAGRGRLLLISGVGPGADLGKLFHGTGIDPAGLRDRITLGRDATDTEENAVETADWVRGNNLHSLIVVTAGYHMQRALTEMTRALPAVTLYPAPVLPPALRRVRRFGTIRLLAGEYTKWLAAEVGLTRFHG
jgi:uncharacterized SAM-binding protein YcdF (DUF218 family)